MRLHLGLEISRGVAASKVFAIRVSVTLADHIQVDVVGPCKDLANSSLNCCSDYASQSQMKELIAKLSKLRGVRWSKKSFIKFFAVFIGGAIFTPMLPWTGRHDYRPIWESVAAAEKDANYKLVNIELLKQKYKKQGLSSNEIKCVIGRDVFFDVLESQAITTNSLADNLGLRSSSVPAFLAANTIALSVFTELSRLDLNKSLINQVADKCRDYPGRFASRADLDSARQ